MFEVFHDFQYLTIVWVFNRKRAQSDAGSGAFTRFVFGRSGAFIGVYLGMIVAFGGLRYVEEALMQGFLRNFLTGVIATTGLLHYYYDGFIWKVRDEQVRQMLGLHGTTGVARLLSPSRLRHAGKWALFAAPLLFLAYCQVAYPPSPEGSVEALVLTMPQDATAQLRYGEVSEDRKRYVEAARAYRAAIRANPQYAEAHLRLGVVSRYQGGLSVSELHLCKAITLAPNADSHVQLSRMLVARHKLDAAGTELRKALQIDPPPSRRGPTSELCWRWRRDRERQRQSCAKPCGSDPTATIRISTSAICCSSRAAARKPRSTSSGHWKRTRVWPKPPSVCNSFARSAARKHRPLRIVLEITVRFSVA